MVTVLVLGRSVVFGHALDNAEKAWPFVLRDELERELGIPVRLEVRRLTPDGRDPTAYLQRMLDEVQPDVVNIMPSPHDFAVPRVASRINELFGVHIGKAARWVERKSTRPSQPGKQGSVNRWSRRIAHRFIGARPDVSREQVETTLNGLYRFLARQESLAVVVRESPEPSTLVRERNPKYAELRDDFNDTWKRKSLEHHFFWAPADEQAEGDVVRDGVHTTAGGQHKRALTLLPSMLQAIRHVQDADGRMVKSGESTRNSGSL